MEKTGNSGELTHLKDSAKFVQTFDTTAPGWHCCRDCTDLEASFFAWAPLLSTEARDADDLLTGPESISPDDIAAEFAALEELKRTKKVQSINEVEVLEGNAFDFDGLDRVEQGIISQTVLDEIKVVNYNDEGDGWDEATFDVIIRNVVHIPYK
ncbi:hypothetical protein DFJ58DRAFT_798927 [Suillus subalutaceus]|uniref:uncharacterized protein n=1 Tax=Suillus subalutaceus TaxID=48586 RepID=UPI001B87F529|nr:uncharacterized protein DFJ58DRAFT_798927 [Suillus subalutaceus]KAG1846587.1 hypothetical protein DFJ58DRAFT_798927 [Suillus subalutaceus]